MRTLSKLFLAMTVLMHCSGMKADNPDWLKNAIFYQIYPSTFQDSDGNGIGDIPGIISRLDYLSSLGITGIWLNPLYESGWLDGGYDVIDYYKVDKRMGTNADLERLLTEAHKRGIRVFLDIVAGHTSNESEWFKRSMNSGSGEKYSDYFIWTDTIPETEKALIRERQLSGHPESDSRGDWVEIDAPRGKYYKKNFFECQPALNYGYANPDPQKPWEQSVDAPGPKAVLRELKDIMAFWFDKGVDGFRVDMAPSLVKNDPGEQATIKLWQGIRKWMDEEYPGHAMVAEWGNISHAIPAGFSMDFYLPGQCLAYRDMMQNPDCVGALPGAYFEESGRGRVDRYSTLFKQDMDTLRKYDAYVAFPTACHDFRRLNNGTRNTTQQLKVAMTFLLTQPGIPFIYYGDEIGIRYIEGLPSKEGSNERAGTRTPMQWTNGQNAGFSTCPPDDIYLPVNTFGGTISVEAEEKNPGSLLNFTRELLRVRKSSDALGSNGDWEFISDVNQPYPMVYVRSLGNEKYLVALNPRKKKASATIPNQGEVECVLHVGKEKYTKGKGFDRISLDGVSCAIYRVK